MFTSTSTFLAAASTEDASSPFVGFVLLVLGVGLGSFIVTRFFSRKSREAVDSATGGAVDTFAVLVAPAPPFPDAIAALRALVGETSPAPQITRYTKPVVTVGSVGLTISDKKLGTLLTIPVADISGIESKPATIRPKGTILPRVFPAIWVSAKRGTAEASIALAPIVGAYTKVSPARAQAIATELAAKLGKLRS